MKFPDTIRPWLAHGRLTLDAHALDGESLTNLLGWRQEAGRITIPQNVATFDGPLDLTLRNVHLRVESVEFVHERPPMVEVTVSADDIKIERSE